MRSAPLQTRPEGIEGIGALQGKLEFVVTNLVGGLRFGKWAFTGSATMQDLRAKAHVS